MKKYKGMKVNLTVDRFLELLRAEDKLEQVGKFFDENHSVMLLSDFEEIMGSCGKRHG